MERLRILDLGSCGCLGGVPAEIGALTLLQKLHLDRCWRLQELPEEIGLLASLRTLDLRLSGVNQTQPLL